MLLCLTALRYVLKCVYDMYVLRHVLITLSSHTYSKIKIHLDVLSFFNFLVPSQCHGTHHQTHLRPYHLPLHVRQSSTTSNMITSSQGYALLPLSVLFTRSKTLITTYYLLHVENDEHGDKEMVLWLLVPKSGRGYHTGFLSLSLFFLFLLIHRWAPPDTHVRLIPGIPTKHRNPLYRWARAGWGRKIMASKTTAVVVNAIEKEFFLRGVLPRTQNSKSSHNFKYFFHNHNHQLHWQNKKQKESVFYRH